MEREEYLARRISDMAAEGKQNCNLAVGDLSPTEIRIPRFLEENIREMNDMHPRLRKALEEVRHV